MNEQFKLLAEQAQIGLFEDKSFGWSVIAGTDQHLSKFAELIVKEMCDVFDKRAEPGTGFYEPHEPAELIKQHFGVEE